ncbi:hypothetical protein [Streptomyces chrestomyceticus]|uniref:hypothetical protein n=1 Tax=Streptomyces chrestomyceticus TaxID=68185 RepID=UPI0033C54C17
MGAVGGGVLAMVLALVVVPGPEKPAGSGKGGGASASPEASDAPGLSRGHATAAGALGTRRIGGAPRGFPHTQDGAIEAAASAMGQSLNMFRMSKSDRAAYQKDLYVKAPPAEFEDRGAIWRAQNNVNEDGQLIDPVDNRPQTEKRLTTLCHPELGAYKVETAMADAATVTVWYPCLSGVIDPKVPAPLQTQWTLGQLKLEWARGDWRVASSGTGSYSSVPSPSDPGQPVISYAERAKLLEPLGGGWKLFADARASAPAELKEATQ